MLRPKIPSADKREMSTTGSFLRQVHILADLTDAEIVGIEKTLHVHNLTEAEVLFHEGDPGGELYIVESGSVGIRVHLEDGEELEIASLDEGDFFGEMSVFEKEPRSATCVAKTACRLLSLHESDLSAIINNAPGAAAKIMHRMLSVNRQRLDDTGEFLSDMVQWGEAARKRAITDEMTGLYNRRAADPPW